MKSLPKTAPPADHIVRELARLGWYLRICREVPTNRASYVAIVAQGLPRGRSPQGYRNREGRAHLGIGDDMLEAALMLRESVYGEYVD